MRWTIRTRVAALFAVLFIVFGGATLVTSQALLRQGARTITTQEGLDVDPAVFESLVGRSCNVDVVETCDEIFRDFFAAVEPLYSPDGSFGLLPLFEDTVSVESDVSLFPGGEPAEGPGQTVVLAGTRDFLTAGAEIAANGTDEELLAWLSSSKSAETIGDGSVSSNDPEMVGAVVGGPLIDDFIVVFEGTAPTFGEVSDVLAEAAVDKLVDRQRTVGLLSLAIIALPAIAAAAWLAGRALRPLRTIAEVARRASGDSMDERIQYQGRPDEVKDLADTFDGMLDRVSASISRHRRFAADASHELRTPVAALRAEVDATLADPAAGVEAQDLAHRITPIAERSERLIEGLLTLTRADALVLHRQTVDLCDLAGDVLAARIGGVALEVDLQLDDAVAVLGDPVLLRHLVANLVDNACKYTPADGTMCLVVRTVDARAELVVENSGEVLDDVLVSELFDPFRRKDRVGEGGHGLGLPIVRSVAQAHGGSVVAVGRPDGGLEVRVLLPLLRQTAAATGP